MDLLGDYDDSESDSNDDNGSLITTIVPTRGKVTIILPHKNTTYKELFERKQPHIPGNWAGHVFLRIATSTTILLEKQQVQDADVWKDHLEINGWTGPMLLHKSMPTTEEEEEEKPCNGMHVSLSRPFYLQRGSIESFVQCLRERVKYKEKGCFRLCYGEHGMKILTNDECTRTFLVWRIQDVDNFLTLLVEDVDAVLNRYGASPYYRTAQFHISVASIPGNDPTVMIPSNNNNKNISKDDECQGMVIPVTDIHCTFGTTETFVIPLGSAIQY